MSPLSIYLDTNCIEKSMGLINAFMITMSLLTQQGYTVCCSAGRMVQLEEWTTKKPSKTNITSHTILLHWHRKTHMESCIGTVT